MSGNFAFLAFCMDRISPLGRFSMTVCDNPDGSGMSGIEPEYLVFDDGFTIGLLQAKGDLFDAKSKFYIQAHYAKDDSAAPPVKVALFSSLKFMDQLSTLASPPGGEWIQAKKTQARETKSSENPIEARFLDPKNKDDAKLIQQALKDLGYYKGKIDGLFGKGSLRALQLFRKSAMGKDAPQWDMETQNRLFN
jgi:hypothetical protein